LILAVEDGPDRRHDRERRRARHREGLGASLSALQWIAGGYALTFAIGLVTGGRLGDIFGRRRLFLVGVALRCLGAAARRSRRACWSPRACSRAFRGDHDPQGFGIPGLPAGRAAEGVRPVRPRDRPVRRSAPSSADCWWTVRWRGIFLVNVPLGLFALIRGRTLLPESRADDRPMPSRRRRAGQPRRRAGDLPADPRPQGRLAGVDVRLDGRGGRDPQAL
jgi:MFS family permease